MCVFTPEILAGIWYFKRNPLVKSQSYPELEFFAEKMVPMVLGIVDDSELEAINNLDDLKRTVREMIGSGFYWDKVIILISLCIRLAEQEETLVRGGDIISEFSDQLHTSIRKRHEDTNQLYRFCCLWHGGLKERLREVIEEKQWVSTRTIRMNLDSDSDQDPNDENGGTVSERQVVGKRTHLGELN